MRRSPLFLAVVLVPAVAQLACFVVALVLRARYPMDLEWIEGTQLYQAFRVAHGLPVYESPAQGFVATPYPPLFHLVVGAVGRCFGFDWWNGRVVSDASILVALAVQTRSVLRAAPSRRTGWILAVMGAAAVAASYRPLEASMDLARVDTMGFALVAVAAFVACRPRLGLARAALLGVLLCAAVYTKQTNLFYAAWIVAYVARRDGKGAAVASAVGLGLAVPVLVALQRASGGWFWTWLMTMRHHGVVPGKCAVAAAVAACMGALLAVVVADFRRRGWLGAATRFWCGMLAAAVPACVGPWLTPGGWVNNLIGLVFVSVLVALLLVCDALRGMRGDARAVAEPWVLAALSALLLGALYDPMRNVPDAARARDAESLHALVRSMDGDVLLPMYPFVAARDGKSTPQVPLVSYLDTVGPGRINADAAEAIRSRHPEWVVLCGHDQEDAVPDWLGPEYRRERLDLRVQAIQETTGGTVTVLRRIGR